MTADKVVLYRDAFTLHESLTFSSFIHKLDQASFSPYTLAIEPTDSLNEYEIEFSYFPVPLLDKPLLVEVRSLDYFNLRYSEEMKEVFMEASISKGWLVFHLLLWGSLFVLTLYATIASRQVSFFAIPLIWLAPLWILYSRGRQRCRRIRRMASTPK
jgi:hypothetical protein